MLVFGRRWAEIVSLWAASYHRLDDTDRQAKRQLEDAVDTRFTLWMRARYGSLHSLLHLPRPVMVHHIPRYLAHRRSKKGPDSRVAIVVVDGLALDQWLILNAICQAISSRRMSTRASHGCQHSRRCHVNPSLQAKSLRDTRTASTIPQPSKAMASVLGEQRVECESSRLLQTSVRRQR